ncbi:hypothetical protein [Xanthomonas hortorum]|uniref:hypothetical protein n=1 Tax=Xanthomonas hortorum TaxID=56454 RepID=UPI0032E8BEE9
MSRRVTRPGKAVMRPAWDGRSFEVIGVGFDAIGAYRDANWAANQCRVPDTESLRENPQWICVDAKITVTVDAAAVDRGVAQRDAYNASQAAKRLGHEL